MLASYTIRKSINVPDQIGLCVNGKVKMLDCVTTKDAYIGDVIAKYTAELKPGYCIRINIIADEDKYEVSVIKSDCMDDLDESLYEDSYGDEYEDDPYDCCEKIFSKTGTSENVLDVLGDACAYLEKDVKGCDASEKKCEKKTTADDFLKRLKRVIDAALEDDN